jgi:aryl carrier-like protein
MATVQDIVTRAFRKIHVESEDEELQPDTLQRGVDAFNMMLHGWKLRGVDVAHSDLLAADTFPLAPEFQEGTVYVLASRLSPDYTAPANFDADDWFRTIQAAYMTIEPAKMPNALTRMPSVYWRDTRIR